MRYTTQLRTVLGRDKTILVPGAYDAFSAKILKQAGFPVLYMTGSGVTASLTGMPDVGLLTMTEMVDQARRFVNAVDLPVICDADHGYGNPIIVYITHRHISRKLLLKSRWHTITKRFIRATARCRRHFISNK